MSVLHFTTTINVPPQVVFDRIADFAHYNQWLPASNLFKSVMEISENPVRLDSTYIDKGTNATMYGRVTAYHPPEKIAFHQVTQIKVLGLAVAALEVTIAYQLASWSGGTNLTRDVTVQASGLLKLIQSRLLRGIAAESQRILAALKKGLEKTV
jgi:carbon monoxide dehydrogenase subunit G